MKIKQKTKSGFTLIELLVFIAIIGLLLSILIPSLSVAKKKVQSVICRSNLKQWGYVFNMYAYDNNSSFPQSHPGSTNLTFEQAWILGATLPYYEALNMRACPVTKVIDRPPTQYNLGGVFKQWGPFPKNASWWDSMATGSYGFNEWCADPDDNFWGLKLENAIRKTYNKNAYKVPLVGDSAFVDTAPEPHDDPPSNSEHEEAYSDIYTHSADLDWHKNAMKFYAMNRHNQGINMIFVDMHASYVDIKHLWQFKWHENFPPITTINWPTWMESFPD